MARFSFSAFSLVLVAPVDRGQWARAAEGCRGLCLCSFSRCNLMLLRKSKCSGVHVCTKRGAICKARRGADGNVWELLDKALSVCSTPFKPEVVSLVKDFSLRHVQGFMHVAVRFEQFGDRPGFRCLVLDEDCTCSDRVIACAALACCCPVVPQQRWSAMPDEADVVFRCCDGAVGNA